LISSVQGEASAGATTTLAAITAAASVIVAE
jgi:hypothetical protein